MIRTSPLRGGWQYAPRERQPARPPLARALGPALLLVVMLAPQSGQAQLAGPAAIDRQNQLIERQNLDRLREEQERALRQQPVRPEGADLKRMQPPVSVPDLGAACREVRELHIDGAPLLSDATRRALEQRYTGRCLGTKDLEGALGELTRYYIDKGYVTTRAYLPAQDLRSGTLAITVVEGRIERYEVRNQGRAGARVNTWTAFPASAGERLNLRDLEQGIDQVNSVGSNAATLDLAPGSQPGQSVVVVNNTAGFPLRLFTTWDNLGTPSTGKNAASATVSADGLLGLNEVISLTRRQSAPEDREHKSVMTALRVSVPIGYSTLSYDASESSYLNMLSLPSGRQLASEGRTLTQSLALDRVVYRDQAMRVSVSGRLTRQDSRNFLGGEFLSVSSRVLSTMDLAVSGFAQMGGGILNARVGYVKGLKGLGAMRDLGDLPSSSPHAQFEKYTLDLGYARRFELAGQPLAWSTQFSGQYSGYTLYGSQQILIGGPSTVRGSLLNALAGDSGYFVRNELARPWTFGDGAQSIAGRVYVSYDFGSVRNRAPGVPSGSMSGVTLGASAQWRGVSAEVFASRALHLPGSFAPESTLYGVRLSLSL